MRFVAIYIVILLCCGSASSQDSLFSYYLGNHEVENPALINRAGRAQINSDFYIDQVIPGYPVLNSTSAGSFVMDSAGMVRVQIRRQWINKYPFEIEKEFGGTFAYGIRLFGKHRLDLGASAHYFKRTVDWDKLSFGDEIDPRYGFIYPSDDVPRGGSIADMTFDLGLSYQTRSFLFNLSLFDANEPNQSLGQGTDYRLRSYRLSLMWFKRIGSQINLILNSSIDQDMFSSRIKGGVGINYRNYLLIASYSNVQRLLCEVSYKFNLRHTVIRLRMGAALNTGPYMHSLSPVGHAYFGVAVVPYRLRSMFSGNSDSTKDDESIQELEER